MTHRKSVTRRGQLAGRAAALALVTALVAAPAAPAGAAWVAALAGGSKGKAAAGSLSAPTGLVASCVSGTGTTIRVTWSAAARATSYTVLQSTTSETAGFTNIATGVTGTTWTSPARADGFNYYYKVATVTGNWSSAASLSTPRRYIASGNCS
jgi:hypothetical protein